MSTVQDNRRPALFLRCCVTCWMYAHKASKPADPPDDTFASASGFMAYFLMLRPSVISEQISCTVVGLRNKGSRPQTSAHRAWAWTALRGRQVRRDQKVRMDSRLEQQKRKQPQTEHVCSGTPPPVIQSALLL